MIVNLVWNLSAIVNFFFFQCLKYWYCVNLILIKLIFINTCHFHICYIFVDFFFHFQFVNCFWLFKSEFTLPAYIHTYNFDDLSINSSHLKISKYLHPTFPYWCTEYLNGAFTSCSIFQYNHDYFHLFGHGKTLN